LQTLINGSPFKSKKSTQSGNTDGQPASKPLKEMPANEQAGASAAPKTSSNRAFNPMYSLSCDDEDGNNSYGEDFKVEADDVSMLYTHADAAAKFVSTSNNKRGGNGADDESGLEYENLPEAAETTNLLNPHRQSKSYSTGSGGGGSSGNYEQALVSIVNTANANAKALLSELDLEPIYTADDLDFYDL
jgi:hypothetical protein